MLTSAAQAKCKLNAHFECLRQCIDEALCERLATLQQSVDNVAQETVAPLEHSKREIQRRVDIAAQILDTGEHIIITSVYIIINCLMIQFSSAF